MAEYATTKEPTEEQTLATDAYALTYQGYEYVCREIKQNKAELAAIQTLLSEEQQKLAAIQTLVSDAEAAFASKMGKSKMLEDDLLAHKLAMDKLRNSGKVLFAGGLEFHDGKYVKSSDFHQKPVTPDPLESSTALAAGGGAKSPPSEKCDAGTPSVKEVNEDSPYTQMQLRDRRTFTTVKEVIESLVYSYEDSQSTQMRLRDGTTFTNPGGRYCTGIAYINATVLFQGSIYDFSDDVPGIFDTDGANLAEQIVSFYNDGDKLQKLRVMAACFLPINRDAKSKGRNGDLPNVTYFLTLFLLNHGIDFVVVDPKHNVTDKDVRIINVSKVLRDLKDRNLEIRTAFEKTTDGRGLSTVIYQRGNGHPSDKTCDQIKKATGLPRDDIMHTILVPGKYENGLFGGNCYTEFSKSVASVLHQPSIIDEWVRRSNKSSIEEMFTVLDPFSGYALYAAVSHKGYGINPDYMSILAFYQGKYTPLKMSSIGEH